MYAATIFMFAVIHRTAFHCIPHVCFHLPQVKMHMLLHSISSSRKRQHQSHTSEIARNPSLIDYRYFIDWRNQSEKRYSKTVEIRAFL